MATPAIYDIEAVSGDTVELTLVFKDAEGNPLDYTGSTWTAQVRKHGAINPAGSPLAEFDVDDSEVDQGKIVLSIPAGTTDEFSVRSNRWDLRQTLGGKTKTLLRGRFVILERVSEEAV